MTAAPALERRFIGADKIFCFLLKLDIAVAQHSEDALALELEPGEQLLDKEAD